MQERHGEAIEVLVKIYPKPEDVQQEVGELQAAVAADAEQRSVSSLRAIGQLLFYKPTRMALTAGVGLQVNLTSQHIYNSLAKHLLSSLINTFYLFLSTYREYCLGHKLLFVSDYMFDSILSNWFNSTNHAPLRKRNL